MFQGTAALNIAPKGRSVTGVLLAMKDWAR
jgi:hypothetical protein